MAICVITGKILSTTVRQVIYAGNDNSSCESSRYNTLSIDLCMRDSMQNRESFRYSRPALVVKEQEMD